MCHCNTKSTTRYTGHCQLIHYRGDAVGHIPPPRLITQDNPAYERITLNDCVAYSNGLNQDQQLEPQTLSHIVTTV